VLVGDWEWLKPVEFGPFLAAVDKSRRVQAKSAKYGGLYTEAR